MDISVITGESDAAADGGVTHGALLIGLVDAVLDFDADPTPARRRLEEAAGWAAVVDAAAVIAMFQLNDRVADATGAPLDEFALDARIAVGKQLGMTPPS